MVVLGTVDEEVQDVSAGQVQFLLLSSLLFSFFSFSFILTAFHCIVEAGLERLVILLPQHPPRWNYRNVPPCLTWSMCESGCGYTDALTLWKYAGWTTKHFTLSRLNSKPFTETIST